MKRLALSLLGTLALVGICRPAAAQVANAISQNLEVRVDGEKLDNGQYVYIGSSRCRKGVEYTFKATGYTTPIPVLEFWGSSGSSTDCTNPTNRAKVNNTTPQCWLIDTALSVSSTATVTPDATSVFRSNADDTSEECPQVSGSAYSVYVVPLESKTESNPSSPPMAMTGVQTLKAVFTLSQATPDSPTSVKGYTGESELKVTWKKPSDVKALSKFYVVFDHTDPTDSSCSTTVLKEGEPLPTLSEGVVFAGDKTPGTQSTLKDLGSKGIEIGDYVAATVIHRDQAGNDSNQSKVVCLQRIQTDGFLDKCAADPDCKGGFESCALSAPGRREPWLGSLLLLVGASMLFVRRRRN